MSNNPYSRNGPSTPSISEPSPTDAPPAYDSGPGGSTGTATGGKGGDSGKLDVPHTNMSNASATSLLDEERPLPEGWIRQWDPNQKHHFYVDTKANPPRSIWVHPFDDPEYIASIPDKAAPPKFAPPPGPPPTSPSTNEKGKQKGFLPSISNKLNGTPEERERRRQEAIRRQQQLQQQYDQRQQDIRQQGYPGQYAYGGQPGYGPQPGYAPPPQAGGYYPPQQGGYYGPQAAPQPYYQPQYAPPQQVYQQRSSGFGGGSMALPLLGGLAGGFILGDIIGDAGDGGDFGDGGDW